MKVSEHISVNLTTQEHITGSQEYSVALNITNTSGKEISELQVLNTLSAGREISINDGLESSNLNALEDKKRRLIRDLERAVESAYARNRRKKQTFSEKLAIAIIDAVDVYASLFSKRKSQPTTPYWAEEALKIDEWEDVEKLENEVISFEDDDSFLKKAYAINKEKLGRVISKLEKEQSKAFSKGVTLPEGSTITFPFSFKAPHFLKQKKMDLSFKVSYKVENEEVVHTRSNTTRISIYPSAFSVPTGGMVGAAVGYAIKSTLTSGESFTLNWGVLVGSLALGLVISLLASRNPETNKAITVEDFTGGLIIGVLAGLYSGAILTKLQTLI